MTEELSEFRLYRASSVKLTDVYESKCAQFTELKEKYDLMKTSFEADACVDKRKVKELEMKVENEIREEGLATKRVISLEEKLESHNSVLKERDAEVASLNQAYQEQFALIEPLERDLAEAKRRLEESQDEENEAKRVLSQNKEDTRKAQEGLEQERATMAAERAAFIEQSGEEREKALQEQLERIRIKMRDQQASWDRKSQEQDATLEAMQLTLKQQRNDASDERAVQDKESQALRGQVEAKAKENRALEGGLEKAFSEAARAAEKKRQNSMLFDSPSSLEPEADPLTQDSKEKDQALSKLEKELDTERGKVERLEERLAEGGVLIAGLEEEIQKLEAKSGGGLSQKAAAAVRAGMESIRSEIAGLGGDHPEAVARVEAIVAQLAEVASGSSEEAPEVDTARLEEKRFQLLLELSAMEEECQQAEDTGEAVPELLMERRTALEGEISALDEGLASLQEKAEGGSSFLVASLKQQLAHAQGDRDRVMVSPLLSCPG